MRDYNLKPKKRSKIRLFMGKYYYRLKRRIFWMLGDIKFANEKDDNPYRYIYISHSTPLLRKLKDVDM